MWEIRQDDLSGEPTRALIALHIASSRAATPAKFSFALDLSGLQTPEITVWTAWRGPALAGICALKVLKDGTGEVKSMRTDPGHLRQGVASALLEHVIAEARRRGMRRLSLETGVGGAYEPALVLYRKRGFKSGEAFADYQPSAFNQFLYLEL